jgi:type I restriction enzyme S subunit
LDIESYEKIIEENGWLNIYVGKSIRYNKTNTFSDYFREYEKVFGDRDDIIQRICKVFNVPRTTKAEKIATLLAVWNDFLINGIEPTDDMIIDDVITNWTPNKANVSRETWSEFISKIRENNIVPKGYGKHTKRMEELVNGKKL